MKKRSETQTLRAGGGANFFLLRLKGGAKKIRPTADPLPGGAERPKFNQLLENGHTFTYKPSLVRIDARNLELSS